MGVSEAAGRSIRRLQQVTPGLRVGMVLRQLQVEVEFLIRLSCRMNVIY